MAVKKVANTDKANEGSKPVKQVTVRPIDWEYIKNALRKGSTIKNIALALGLDRNTLYNRCKTDNGMDISAFSAQYKKTGIISMEEKLYDMGMEGDKTAAIFWLKCKAGWDDGSNAKNQVTVNNNQPINFQEAYNQQAAITPKPTDGKAT